jgi:hypothetical protein
MKYELKAIPSHITSQTSRSALVRINIHKKPLIDNLSQMEDQLKKRPAIGGVRPAEMARIEAQLGKLDSDWDVLISSAIPTAR